MESRGKEGRAGKNKGNMPPIICARPSPYFVATKVYLSKEPTTIQIYIRGYPTMHHFIHPSVQSASSSQLQTVAH